MTQPLRHRQRVSNEKIKESQTLNLFVLLLIQLIKNSQNLAKITARTGYFSNNKYNC